MMQNFAMIVALSFHLSKPRRSWVVKRPMSKPRHGGVVEEPLDQRVINLSRGKMKRG